MVQYFSLIGMRITSRFHSANHFQSRHRPPFVENWTGLFETVSVALHPTRVVLRGFGVSSTLWVWFSVFHSSAPSYPFSFYFVFSFFYSTLITSMRRYSNEMLYSTIGFQINRTYKKIGESFQRKQREMYVWTTVGKRKQTWVLLE